MDELLEQHLSALATLCPMPPDSDPIFDSEEGVLLLEKYEKSIDLISSDLESGKGLGQEMEIIKLLLSSFGLGEGGGVYWSTLHLIEQEFDQTVVYQVVHEMIGSQHAGVRQWCCLILGRRRALEDLPYLLERLDDKEEPVIIQALKAIAMIGQKFPLPQECIIRINKLKESQSSEMQRKIDKSFS